MADETTTTDTKVLPPAPPAPTPSPAPSPAPAPAPVSPSAPTPDPAPAPPKTTKAKAAAPEAPKTVTVLNDTPYRFLLGVLDGSDCMIVPGETENVDAQMFEAWSKQRTDSDLVKNGLLRAK